MWSQRDIERSGIKSQSFLYLVTLNNFNLTSLNFNFLSPVLGIIILYVCESCFAAAAAAAKALQCVRLYAAP